MFRVRVKHPGDRAWRDAPDTSDCCADDAARALVELGLTPERAHQLIDAARVQGTTGHFRH